MGLTLRFVDFKMVLSAVENWTEGWHGQWTDRLPNRSQSLFSYSPLTGHLLPALQLQVDPAQVAHHARRRLDPLHSLQGGFTTQLHRNLSKRVKKIR